MRMKGLVCFLWRRSTVQSAAWESLISASGSSGYPQSVRVSWLLKWVLTRLPSLSVLVPQPPLPPDMVRSFLGRCLWSILPTAKVL